MKILIVHDRESVISDISAICEEVTSDSIVIHTALDGLTATRLLRDNSYDLMIMDLTLPYVIKSMAPDIGVAEGILREIFTSDSLNPPGDIIGISKDVEAVTTLSDSIGSHLMAIISEDESGDWRRYLGDRIKYAARSAAWRQYSAYRHHLIDVLLFTALDEELEPYNDELEFEKSNRYEGAYNFAFRDKYGIARTGVAFSIGRSGQPRAASRTQSLLSVFRPRLAIMTGICGGFNRKATPGQLMFFETVYDWDYGKWKDTSNGARFVSRAQPISIDGSTAHRVAREMIGSNFSKDPTVLGRLVQLSGGTVTQISMKLAQAASGSAVVAHGEIIAQIENLNDAISAVDMEAYAFYHACTRTHVVPPQALCIKAVSDGANAQKDDELHAACSYLSAIAAVNLIRKWWEFA